MNTIFRELNEKNKGQTILFVIMSILNIVITGVFCKFAEEVQKIKAEAEIVSHDEQLTMYFSMLIAVSIMCILFSVWIMQIICKTVFASRKNVNVQLRIMGLSSKKLSELYVSNFLNYQLIAIPIGIVVMEIVYDVISGMLDIESRLISVRGIILSIVLHLFVILLCLAITFYKCAKFDPLEEMRDSDKSGRVRELTKIDLVSSFVGIVLIVFGISQSASDNMIIGLLPIIGLFLNLDLLTILINKFMIKFSYRTKIISAGLSHRITLGNYKKISPIISTLIVGVMVSIGLMGMFESIREISRKTVQQNIYFTELLVNSDVVEFRSQEDYEKIVNEIDPNAEIAYGINLEMIDEESITNTIYAIDSAYAEYGEKMVLTDGTDPSENLNDENFDGIYLPNYFISESNVGETYSLNLGNETYEFRIAGRFIANGSRGRFGYISKAYLQKMIGLDMVNALYIHSASDSLLAALESDDNVLDRYIITKQQIADNSYENAINGVEIFEFSAFVIVLISLIMFVHYAAANSKQNKQEIVRLKAMGCSKKTLKRTYNLQSFSVFTIAFIIGGILAYCFINAGILMTLEYIDVPIETKFPWSVMVITYVFMNLAGSLAMKLSVNKAYTDKINEYVSDN